MCDYNANKYCLRVSLTTPNLKDEVKNLLSPQFLGDKQIDNLNEREYRLVMQKKKMAEKNMLLPGGVTHDKDI